MVSSRIRERLLENRRQLFFGGYVLRRAYVGGKRIVHRAITILSSGGGARSSSHRARAGEEALLPSSIERLVEESKNKDGHG